MEIRAYYINLVYSKRFFVKGEAQGNSLAAEIKIFAKSPELLTESEIRQLLG